MKNTLSEIDKKLMNDGMIAWLMEIDKKKAFWKATGIKRSLFLPPSPPPNNPDKHLTYDVNQPQNDG